MACHNSPVQELQILSTMDATNLSIKAQHSSVLIKITWPNFSTKDYTVIMLVFQNEMSH